MTTNSDRTIGVGVIGATGFIGTPYRRELRDTQGVRIVALCARRRDLLEQAKIEDGAELITSDWQEVVDHPDVDLVVVATPDKLHLEPVLACAESGKHLLCEKPVGADAKEARVMWEAYRDQPQLATYVPFWTRYLDMFIRAKELVAEGAIGEVRSV